MNQSISVSKAKKMISDKLSHFFGVSPDNATDEQYYKSIALIVRDEIAEKNSDFRHVADGQDSKKVYYLCMEFLMGRSLKNNLYNLGLTEVFEEALKSYGVSLEKIYDQEPDAGLGNGGLGRLAACYLDGLATTGIQSMGYSIRYEAGIFRQKLVDGWQTELPDFWLPGGDVWLVPREERAQEVKFEGYVDDSWDGDFHRVELRDCNTVTAVPYDMYVSGKGQGVSRLRLWAARKPALDMGLFNEGNYIKAMEQSAMAETISKVLYPADNSPEGKSLRLRQQYFLVSASVQDIIRRHLTKYNTLDNLPEKIAIHINDTHPTMAIPELMRIMLDECGYGWDDAWNIVTKTVAYTNHTVMPEALEKWDCNLLKSVCPRIFSIIIEINERYCKDLWERYKDQAKVSHMSIVEDNKVKMATLCVHACHSVNGVAKIHSEIIKKETFKDEYLDTPTKFKNVTNGIAYRRWLYQSNEGLTDLLCEKIGDGFLKNAAELSKLAVFKDDKDVLDRLAKIKLDNKKSFAKYVKNQYGVVLNTDSIFDVQVKRLHEYKRQQLNALNIIAQYNYLKANPNADFVPKTYIFGAKAAPGYYMAKQIIKLIWNISQELKKDKKLNEKLNVIFLEDYNVSLSEILMPAANISEQISLAGTEASGTGNMKLMINGAITLGTLDGANVEIHEQVGDDNIIIFGMNVDEVNACKSGYKPMDIYNSNAVVKQAIDTLQYGINGQQFNEIADSLKNSDPYMALKDFDSYQKAQAYASECYKDQTKWQKMSLANIAGAGIFSADRSVEDYARDIWGLSK